NTSDASPPTPKRSDGHKRTRASGCTPTAAANTPGRWARSSHPCHAPNLASTSPSPNRWRHPMANILTAFDPGTTPGWVEVSLDTFELIDGGQFTAWKQATAERLPLFDDDNITVAYESFVLRRGAYTSDQIEPVYVIGAIEALADGLPIYHYPPSSTKTVT